MIVLLLMFSGCIPLASDIQNVGNETIKLSALIDDLQTAVTESQLIESETQEKINEEIDKVQTTLVDVAKSVKEANYVDGDDIGNAIKAAQAANAASAPVNPYAPMIEIGLGLATLLAGGAGVFGVKKTMDAKKSNMALKETVKGIQDMKKTTGALDANTLKSLLANAQSTKTKEMIAVLRAGM